MIEIIGTKQKEETYGLIAKTWQAINVGDSFKIIQPNDRGGKSLEKTIKKHFPNISSESYDKARHITITKTDDAPDIINEWITHTHIRFVDDIGFYSVPGLFGWNKIDMGSTLLLDHIPQIFKGTGADFGCGYGYLSKNILDNHPDIQTLYCFDIDDRAVAACAKNIVHDDRAVIDVQDCTCQIPNLPPLDFIISNPPFHHEGGEDRTLGQKFIKTMASHLKKGGVAWIVANQHMPYEDILSQTFTSFDMITQEKGFKIFKAVR